MQNYLLLCRSITYAQRMKEALVRVGLQGKISRPPVGLSEKGCSYAVHVKPMYYSAAIHRLREIHLLPERVFYSAEDGSYREITPY